MDLFDLILTIAILAVGSFLTGGKKFGKKAAPAEPQVEVEMGDVDKGDLWEEFLGREEEQVQEYPYQEEASSLEENTEEACSLEEIVPEEASLEEPVTEYFSYENQAAEESLHAAVQQQLTVSEEEPRNVLGQVFNLRQAFIYQTILERVNC